MEATIELIKITGVSQYCVFAGSVRYGFNKPVESTQFQKGHTYSVAVVAGTKGGKYISRVDNDLGVLSADQPSTTPALNPSFNQASVPSNAPRRSKQGEPLTPYDLATQERISRAGVLQAAVQAVASHASSVDDLKTKAFDLAESMLTWVNNSQPVK